MQHEKFRKVTMLAAVVSGGGIGLITPAGAGELTQYMPAAVADAMREAEQADAAKLPAEKQRIFYKNGIEKIGKKDFYAHDVTLPDGQRVTEYREDEPETKASAAATAALKAATPSADVQALVGAIGGLVAIAQANQPQPAQNYNLDDQPNPAADLVANTTAANEQAAATGQVISPVGGANGTDGQANTDSDADKSAAKTDADTSKTDTGADTGAKTDADASKLDPHAAAAKQAGKPGAKAKATPAAK